MRRAAVMFEWLFGFDPVPEMQKCTSELSDNIRNRFFTFDGSGERNLKVLQSADSFYFLMLFTR